MCCLCQGIEEAGTRLAQVLTKKESIAKMKASMPSDVAKALARVSGGLYVVAAVNNSARGAMLASWVAQASFEPLGLTVAVAKDRAIESLMQVSAQPAFACAKFRVYCSMISMVQLVLSVHIVTSCVWHKPPQAPRSDCGCCHRPCCRLLMQPVSLITLG